MPFYGHNAFMCAYGHTHLLHNSFDALLKLYNAFLWVRWTKNIPKYTNLARNISMNINWKNRTEIKAIWMKKFIKVAWKMQIYQICRHIGPRAFPIYSHAILGRRCIMNIPNYKSCIMHKEYSQLQINYNVAWILNLVSSPTTNHFVYCNN